MKQGDEIVCPHCGKDSFLVKTSLMDGWTFKGDALVCSLCKQKVTDITKGKMEYDSSFYNDEKLKKFTNFLGEEKISKPKIENDEEKLFCRDCKYYISHPFLNRCGLHTKEVNPMDDCPDFIKKT